MINRILLLIALLLCIALPSLSIAQDAVDRASYVLATGDVIYIRVYDEEDLSMRLAVPADGTVRYAFVGDFQLSGKSIDQIEQEIMQRLLGDYLVNPQVSISMAEFRDFYIQGAVARTGGIPWQPGLTVRTALTLAGGLRERASKSKWYLVPEGGSESDRRRVSEDDPVSPGDTIIVDESFF
jgi:protein involved in polysaccharide export with SLBB domain